MWSGTKNADATWELIKFISTDIEVQVGVTTLLNYGMPVIRAAWDDPRLKEQKARPPRELEPITEPIGEGKGFMTQLYPNYGEIRGVYLEAMRSVWEARTDRCGSHAERRQANAGHARRVLFQQVMALCAFYS